MGDRISISFKKGEDESIALFSHWRGRSLLDEVQEYLDQLETTLKKRKSNICSPIDRMEPDTVIIDFIRWLTKGDDIISGDLYLGKDGTEGDNSDNGHFVFNLDSGLVDGPSY